MKSNMMADEASGASLPRRSRAAIVIPIIVLVLMSLIIAWSAWPTLAPARSVEVVQAVFDRSAEYEAAEVTSSSTTQPDNVAPRSGITVQAAGWLEAEPYYTACTALADGVVESMHVLEGDYVEAGQLVAQLVAEDSELRLGRAEADLATARSNLILAEAELRAAQTDWDEAVERERAVASGRAALAESEAALARLPSLITEARATLVRFREEMDRAQESWESGAASEIELVIAQQKHEMQLATVASLEAERPLLKARVDRLKSEFRAAERNLELRIEERLKLDAAKAGIVRARAELNRAEVVRAEAALELDRMTILAPIDGYVQSRLKVPGDKVVRMMDSPHSAHLVHLYDPKRIQVRVDVPLADAAHVYVGQECEVVVEVLPDQIFRGRVLLTTHEADLQKNTLQVKVKVIDPSPLLRPEMLTRVKFLGSDQPRRDSTGEPETEARGRILVPSHALIDSDGSPHVWVVTERRGDRGVVRSVDVELVTAEDGWTAVNAPLTPGALLAVADEPLSDGESVRIHADLDEEDPS